MIFYVPILLFENELSNKPLKIAMKKIILLLIMIIFSLQLSYSQKLSQDDFVASLPEYDWGILLNIPNFKLNQTNYKPDGTARNWTFAYENLIISVFIEKVPQKGNSAECKEYYFSRAKLARNIDINSIKNFTLNEFECADFFYISKDTTVKNRSCNMYYSRDDIWVDIHFTFNNYLVQDSTRFEIFKSNFKVINDVSDNIAECFAFGMEFYMRGKYAQSIPYYEQALKADKVRHKLEKKMSVILIDNLGMAYGVTGRMDKAKTIFEYGIETYSDQPCFYYNLACCYAELENKVKAIENLKLAKKYRENSIDTPKFSDPSKDSSFEKLMKDEEFIQAVNEFIAD